MYLIFNNSLKLNLILLYVFIFFIPIDMVNGLLIRNVGFSFSIYVKLLMLTVVLVFLLRTRYQLLISILTLIAILVYSASAAVHSELVYFDTGFSILKFVSVFIYGAFFIYILKRYGEKKLIRVIIYTYLFLLLNTFLGMIGFGFPMYGDDFSGIGTRGLIFAGNELGVVTLIAGCLLMSHHILHKHYLIYSLIGISLIFNSLMLGSKVAMLGSMLIFIGFSFIHFCQEVRRLKLSLKLGFLVFLFAGFVILLSHYVVSGFFHTNIGTRILHFYQNYDFLTFLLSGRDLRISHGIEVYVNHYSLSEVLFGSSRLAIYSESDFFDVLFVYGLVGLLFVLTLFLCLIFLCVLKSKVNPYALYILFMLILLFLIANIAGHAIVSGTASFMLAMLVAFIFYDKSDSHESSIGF